MLSDTDDVAALREAKVLLVPCVVERTEEEQVPFVMLRELARLAFHFHLDVTSIDGALPQMLAEPEPEVQADLVVLGEKLAHYAGFDGVRKVA